jgi:hypothetical protein
MEAVRILRALNVKPKRTIRIALWSGEEEGEFGSKGYVAGHFGGFAPSSPLGSPGALITKKEWEKLDAYYNLDEGGGKVRGIYTQGNYQVDSIFSQWMAELKDLGVTSVTNRSDPGSDHESFDDVGLPGFNLLQDELDYEARTHHSNLDTVDHLHAADLEQAAVVEAIFVWNTSEREAIMPRKPFPHPEDDQRMKGPIPGLLPNATPRGHRPHRNLGFSGAAWSYSREGHRDGQLHNEQNCCFFGLCGNGAPLSQSTHAAHCQADRTVGSAPAEDRSRREAVS